MKTIETEILIDAAPEKVWTVLMDFNDYPEWNPFVTSISGEASVGNQITVTLKPPEGKPMKFKPNVLSVDAPSEFRWKGKLLIPGVFDGEHYFKLFDIGKEQTRLVHGENFTGLLVPLMGGVLNKTKTGFELMNKAIQARSES